MGDVDTAQHAGECALQMKERCGSEAGRARTFLDLHVFIFHHVKPLHLFSKPLLEGCQSGMRSGEKAHAMWCLLFHVVLLYMTGKPLKSIEEQCQ
eukprot:1420688-Ditylum_brightwellii.AAC.1